jgi:hypothetical protein
MQAHRAANPFILIVFEIGREHFDGRRGNILQFALRELPWPLAQQTENLSDAATQRGKLATRGTNSCCSRSEPT